MLRINGEVLFRIWDIRFFEIRFNSNSHVHFSNEKIRQDEGGIIRFIQKNYLT